MSRVGYVAGVAMRNAALRRVGLAFLAFNAAEWGVWIAMLVYAYDRGGATTAGLVAAAQLVPAALVAPFAARHVTRLATGYAVQAAAMGATAAVLLAHGPPVAAYACAALAATAVTATRPAQAALLPALARTADELTAANVLYGWVESASLVAAPAATGGLLAVSSPGAVFAVMTGAALAAAAIVAREPSPAGLDGPRPALLAELRRDGSAAFLVGVLGAEAVAIGALDVLYVVLAIGEFDRGGSWAGYLNAAFGAGGVAGTAVTATLVGRRRLAPVLVAAAAAWALAFALLAAAPRVATAVGLLALAGVSRVVLDVAGRTLLQRTVPPERIAGLFGVVEGASSAGLAVGSLLTPALVAVAGARGALAGVAALFVAASGLAARRLARIDGAATVPVVDLALLRSVPMLAPLDAPTLESLARALVPRSLARGDTLLRQGDVDDRYWVVADGELDVFVDGAHVRTATRGEGVGELALLLDVPRTATVVARTDCEVRGLERELFLAAVTRHPRSTAVGANLVRDRLPAVRIAG